MTLDITTLTLVVIIAVLFLTLAFAVASLSYKAREARLPAATRFVDVEHRLRTAQEQLGRSQDELREVEQKILERDRFGAEVEVLKRMIAELKGELANLDAAREEIEQVKQEAAAASGEHAVRKRELAELMEQMERVRAELDPDRIERLRRERAEVEDEVTRIRSELGPIRAEYDAALRTVAEASAVQARVEALKIETERLEAKLDVLLHEAATARDARKQAQMECDDACRERDAALRTVAEGGAAQARVEALKVETERLKAKLDELLDEMATARDALGTIRAERDNVLRERDVAAAERARALFERDRVAEERIRLEARVAELEARAAALTDQLGTAHGPGVDPGSVDPAIIMADLTVTPAALASPVILRGVTRPEPEALHDVSTYLEKCGLRFSRRTLHAFHTALKINDAAQLTVLAGVSGTGKSILPRRYAEALGIHFLQVAVEPRWDSPQDLLGFYNYVEKKYRATELARLLANLDPWQGIALPTGAPDQRKHMALVLLDEMNLARVEYYFSEFLSRLEARPAWREALDRANCKDALIPVDIRGLKDAPSLFPAHNILFVGTMNDDESTQSLSDKVLDRGNILQFPAPDDFPPPAPHHGATRATDAQAFKEWRGWVRPAQSLEGQAARQTQEVIGRLAGLMQGFGRPFGHRLNQAIRAYVANYPNEGNAGPNAAVPLADQIELRILPRLRGVQIDGDLRARFDDLATLVETGLGDRRLAERLRQTVEEQESGAGLFVWRGLARS